LGRLSNYWFTKHDGGLIIKIIIIIIIMGARLAVPFSLNKEKINKFRTQVVCF
jgi:hypothetical protein